VLKKIIVSACIAGIGLFVSCSNLNDSSTLGGQIITNSDPNRSDFSKSFEYFDTLSVLGQFSVAEPADTSIGTGAAIVGKNSVKTVRAIYGFAHDSTFRFKNRARTLRSTVVRIGADTLKINDSTKKVLSSINVLFYNTSLLTKPLDISIPQKTIQNKLLNDNSIFSDTLNPLTTASIDSTLKSYREKDSGKYNVKLIVTSEDTLFWLQANPRLIFIYDSLGHTIIDSITSGYRSNVQFDDPSVKTAFDPIPVSSIYSGRYAVFKLDLKSLWTDMAKRPGFTTILSVPLVISGQSLVATDSLEKYYYYYVSPNLFSSPEAIKDSMQNMGSVGRIGTGKYLDTVPAENFFSKLTKNKPEFAYLYLRGYEKVNVFSDQSIRWSNPVITGVFTNNQ
jgi:hypothetical protein